MVNVHNKIREPETRARSLDSRPKVQARAAHNTETLKLSLRVSLEPMRSWNTRALVTYRSLNSPAYIILCH